MSATDYLSNSIASAPDIPTLMPSFAASFETFVMLAVSISSRVLTSDTVAHTSSIQASTLMYPHPMKPFCDFTMSKGAPRFIISFSSPDQSNSALFANRAEEVSKTDKSKVFFIDLFSYIPPLTTPENLAH